MSVAVGASIVTLTLIQRALTQAFCMSTTPMDPNEPGSINPEQTNCWYQDTQDMQDTCILGWKYAIQLASQCEAVPDFHELNSAILRCIAQYTDPANSTKAACVSGALAGGSAGQAMDCAMHMQMQHHKTHVSNSALLAFFFACLTLTASTFAIKHRKTLSQKAEQLIDTTNIPASFENMVLAATLAMLGAAFSCMVAAEQSTDNWKPLPPSDTNPHITDPTKTMCQFQPNWNASQQAGCVRFFEEGMHSIDSCHSTLPPPRSNETVARSGFEYGAAFETAWRLHDCAVRHDHVVIPLLGFFMHGVISAAMCLALLKLSDQARNDEEVPLVMHAQTENTATQPTAHR